MNLSRSEKRNTHWVVFLILLLSIYPAFLMNDAKQNILLLFLMGISPIYLLFKANIMPKFDVPLVLMYVLMIMFTMAFHPRSMRWSTIIYTGMFISFFMSYVRILYSSRVSVAMLMKLFRGIFYAYAIVLIIQLGCFFVGLPIFNEINIDLGHGFPRLNSCGPEPSWSARMLSIMLFLYIYMRDFTEGYKLSFSEFIKRDKKIFLSYVFVIIASGSTTGLVFGLFVLSRFVNARSIIGIVLLAVLLVSIGSQLDISSFERLGKVLPAVLTLDPDVIIEADGSGATRIVPTLYALDYISLENFEGWFGHGVDFDSSLFQLGTMNLSGGAFSLWMNYGVIVQVLFWAFIFRTCYMKKEWLPIMLCALIIAGGISLNLQVLWFMLAMFATVKYALKLERRNA